MDNNVGNETIRILALISIITDFVQNFKIYKDILVNFSSHTIKFCSMSLPFKH